MSDCMVIIIMIHEGGEVFQEKATELSNMAELKDIMFNIDPY